MLASLSLHISVQTTSLVCATVCEALYSELLYLTIAGANAYFAVRAGLRRALRARRPDAHARVSRRFPAPHPELEAGAWGLERRLGQRRGHACSRRLVSASG